MYIVTLGLLSAVGIYFPRVWCLKTGSAEGCRFQHKNHKHKLHRFVLLLGTEVVALHRCSSWSPKHMKGELNYCVFSTWTEHYQHHHLINVSCGVYQNDNSELYLCVCVCVLNHIFVALSGRCSPILSDSFFWRDYCVWKVTTSCLRFQLKPASVFQRWVCVCFQEKEREKKRAHLVSRYWWCIIKCYNYQKNAVVTKATGSITGSLARWFIDWKCN